MLGEMSITPKKDPQLIFVNCPLFLDDRSSLTKKARLNVPVLQPRTSLSARAEWVRPKLKLSFVRALGRRAKPMPAAASRAATPSLFKDYFCKAAP